MYIYIYDIYMNHQGSQHTNKDLWPDTLPQLQPVDGKPTSARFPWCIALACTILRRRNMEKLASQMTFM